LEDKRGEKLKGLTLQFSKLAHKIHPQLGKFYDSDPIFWNDGMVGFVVGVPLTWLLYNSFLGFFPGALFQFLFYIACALISFIAQHLLRRKWVFKGK